jgi:hypothetical protein
VSGRPQHPLATTSLDSSPVPAPALNQPQLSEAFFRHALATYSVPVQVQTLDNKALLSATVVDAPVVETPVVDAPVTDAPVADTPVGEAPVEPPSTEAMGDDVWIEDVQATVIIGETQVDGNVFSSQGDYTGMTSTLSYCRKLCLIRC